MLRLLPEGIKHHIIIEVVIKPVLVLHSGPQIQIMILVVARSHACRETHLIR
jgi:hypothetical protein